MTETQEFLKKMISVSGLSGYETPIRRIIEETSYNADGSVRDRSTYSYEYDSYGNPIKQIRSDLVKKNGESSFVPLSVTYFSTTYYPETGNP